jgi:outer membrane protein TolC
LQAIDTYRGLIDKATLETKEAQRGVYSYWKQMVVARQARIAAEEELRRLTQDQERPGSMSPSFIETRLDAQLRLGDVQRQEIQAMQLYNLALAELEQAKGTLLRYDHVTLEEDSRTIPLTWK